MRGAPQVALVPQGRVWHNSEMRTLAVLIFCLVAALPHGVRAAESYQVGFCTLGSWSADKNLRLDVNVWYPSVRPPRDLSYPPWEFSAARGGKAVEGRFPLLLLSHDTAGTRFSYHDTASWLASRGFVVAAPTHARDNLDHMEDLLTWSQLQTRAQELSGVIDLLLADPETASSVDADRIGVLGFGAGGAAALLLGGALPDCTAWNSYCGMAGRNDLYCNPWARTRMDKLCQSLPLTKSLADPRVRAVAAVAPGFGMLFSRAAFRWFYPPLLLVAAQNDQNNPPALHARHIYKNMEKKPRWLYLPGADAAAFAAPCPEALAAELPELCRPMSDSLRGEQHQALDTALADFFLHYLGGDNPPQIPPPPDLTPPQPQPQPAPPPTIKARKKRG